MVTKITTIEIRSCRLAGVPLKLKTDPSGGQLLWEVNRRAAVVALTPP